MIASIETFLKDLVGGIVVILVVAAIYLWKEIPKYLKAKEAARREQEREETRRRANIESDFRMQNSWKISLEHACNHSSCLFESLPEQLVYAENNLDAAELNFQDRAFAPFWDSIEKAAIGLGNVDNAILQISENANKFKQLSTQVNKLEKRFPITEQSVEAINYANGAVISRLNALIRNAQCDFQFASIFEQRRTNQLLIAGFNNLADVLSGMERRLVESINGLGSKIENMQLLLDHRLNDFCSATERSQLNQLDISADKDARYAKVVDILSDIQHRRKPYSFIPRPFYTKY